MSKIKQKDRQRYAMMQERKSIKFPWLTSKEVKVMMKGGYFDKEGVIRNEDNCIRCTHTVLASGKRCKNFATEGMTVCKFHGGGLKRRHERLYSAFIQDPTIAAVYENVAEDEQVAGIKEELSLLRSLLGGLLRSIDMDDQKDIKDVAKIIGEIRQLVTDCTKAEVRLGQLIDIGKITIIIGSLAKIIQRHVKDEEILKKIARDFDKLVWPSPVASTTQPERDEPLPKVPELPGALPD